MPSNRLRCVPLMAIYSERRTTLLRLAVRLAGDPKINSENATEAREGTSQQQRAYSLRKLKVRVVAKRTRIGC